MGHREYLLKGFALDDQRLKNDGVDTHFDELLERIRDIRASERQFFRKICDVISATSADYEERKSFPEVRNFLASIQNRLHFATHGKTAAKLIWERSDRNKPHAGLTNWPGNQPLRADLGVAKNYLTQDELTRMNRLTTMFLDYAEDQASLHKTILLDEWIQKTEKLTRKQQLFVYLTQPDGVSQRKATTNSPEGGINAAIKTLLHNHRGLPEGHQRVDCDWWLYLHTQLPDDPEKIARQQHWGQAGLAKAQAIITHEHEVTYGNADGRPATYDTAIDSTPTNPIGIRKGWAGRS